MGKIVVFGDSIAYGKWDEKGGWVARLREYIDQKYNLNKTGNVQIYNQGIPGEVAIRMVNRVKEELAARIEPHENNVVIFAIGINDANPKNWMTMQQTSPEEFKKALKEMAAIAQKQNTKVVFIGLAPININKWLEGSKFKDAFFDNHAEEYEKYLTEVCEESNVPKLSIYEELNNEGYKETILDGIHPNTTGHEMLYTKILKFLEDQNFLVYIQ